MNRARDLSSLRHVLYGSNPIPLPVLRQFSEFFSCTLSQIGGVGTEGGVALVLGRVDHEGGAGRPFPRTPPALVRSACSPASK